jgi:acetolactate synthase-1/2/3 large subunit
VLTVVLNNGGYGAVRDSVSGMYPTGYATKGDDMPLTSLSPSPDFRLVAESCRAYAETVTVRSELPAALERAIEQVAVHRRQALLDVHIA